MNQSPENGDFFLVRKLYRFIPDIKGSKTIFIELEIYEYNICVLSFYEETFKSHGKKRYQIRSNIGPGEVKARFKACLEAYYQLQEESEEKYALVFASANDIDEIKEDNPRKVLINYSYDII